MKMKAIFQENPLQKKGQKKGEKRVPRAARSRGGGVHPTYKGGTPPESAFGDTDGVV